MNQKDYDRLDKAIALVSDDKSAEALSVLEDLSRSYPTDGDAFHWLAAAQSSLGQQSEALANYQKAITLSPHDIAPYLYSATIYTRRGENKIAISLLKTGISQMDARHPFNSDYARGLLAFLENDFESAETHLLSARSNRAPADPYLLPLVANAQFQLGKLAASRNHYETLVRDDEISVGDLMRLAQIQRKMGDKKAAYVSIDNACIRAPNDIDLLKLRCHFLLRDFKIFQAWKDGSQIIQMTKVDPTRQGIS